MNRLFSFFILLLFSTMSFAQDDLLALAEENSEEIEQPISSFFTSRLAIGHSVETHNKGQLVLHITHRFGAINTGAYELWGLDAANIRIGFDYGVTDRINIGYGRSKVTKTYDAFLKYKLLQQIKDGFPLTLTAIVGAAIVTEPKKEDAANYGLTEIVFSDRLSYLTQVLIARNFSNKFSLQLMPTYVHKNNLALYENDDLISENGTFAMGAGSSVKITKLFAVNLEYYYRVNAESSNPHNDAFSVGLDLETGGHVFQIHFSNSFKIGDRAFITETNDDFFAGDIHLGFNISRTFQL